jgi:lipopolysaccharide transport system ATP-binding protein
MIGFEGDTLDAVHYYQTTGVQPTNRANNWDADEAPGNENIKVLSFSAKPIEGKLLNVDSGLKLCYSFHNQKEGINLGSTIEVITKEEVIVFHKGAQITTNNDSKKRNL